MAQQPKNRSQSGSDEIDLGQLFQLIRSGFDRIFDGILRVFLYLRKRRIILLTLIIAGLLIGYGLSLVINKKQKVEIIVKPNLESKNYLYNVISEVGANLKARDTSFFRNLGMSIENFQGYEIDIEPVGSEDVQDEAQMEYLELLQKFENNAIITDVLRAEILEKTPLNHRITLTFNSNSKGEPLARAIIKYINTNSFFAELTRTSIDNANMRIEANNVLVQQIDQIVSSYSDQMARSSTASAEGKILVDSEERLDITGLFELKNALIRDTERKKLELIEQKEPITIINFGKPQEITKQFFTKTIVQIPLILIGLFLLLDVLRYLNRKAMEHPSGGNRSK